MQDHYAFSDTAFEAQFKAGTFPAELFTHEAHLRLAWIHIHRYGVAQAEENIVQQLQDYVAHLGATDKFNMTLTVAAIKAVAHFKAKANHTHFKDFITAFPRLQTHFKELLAQHYQNVSYTSEEAKRVFVEPDVMGF